MSALAVELPGNATDADFIVDCACDHAQESLRNTGLLPHGSLVSEDMLTLIVCKGSRRIGVVSSVSGTSRETGETRTEVDSWYLLPRWRNKKYLKGLFEALQEATPHPLFIRGPIHSDSAEVAGEMNILHCAEGRPEEMKMITDLVLGAIPCEAAKREEPPCFGCVRSTFRTHFTQQCGKMILKAHIYQAATP